MARPREFDEQQVVAQATDLFWEKGYRRTTPADLLAATGLSKSSLYATFGSKQGLFIRAVEAYVAGQTAGMRAMLDRPTLREALDGLYDAIITTSTCGDAARSCLVCSASLEVDPSEAEVVERVRAATDSVLSVITERIERAQAAGEIAVDRDAKALARLVQNNNMGMVVLARAGASPEALRSVANQVVAAVCG
ncbi:MAG: TetR/AcrR family transcriptional regulator [Planctomycetota bacterium]|jgi:TetR/AcrR family transcriptional repressor of nem operon